MNDLIRCSKCGKETNKYSKVCEHCLESIVRNDNESPEKPNPNEHMSADAIETQAKTLFEEMERYSNHVKKCPFCAEDIQAEVIKCKHCGELQERPVVEWKRYKTIIACIGALAVLWLLYTGVSGLINGSVNIKVGRLSDELKSDPVKAEYVKKFVTLTNIGTLDETDPKATAPTKYLYGTLKNSGDKTIIKLKVGVYYFDRAGRCVAEGSIEPILSTKAKRERLNPNSSKDFRFPAANLNPKWSRKVMMKISDIELL